MGGVPVKHRSKSKVRTARAHKSLKRLNISPCANCGGPVFGHRICQQCGALSGKATSKQSA